MNVKIHEIIGGGFLIERETVSHTLGGREIKNHNIISEKHEKRTEENLKHFSFNQDFEAMNKKGRSSSYGELEGIEGCGLEEYKKWWWYWWRWKAVGGMFGCRR